MRFRLREEMPSLTKDANKITKISKGSLNQMKKTHQITTKGNSQRLKVIIKSDEFSHVCDRTYDYSALFHPHIFWLGVKTQEIITSYPGALYLIPHIQQLVIAFG